MALTDWKTGSCATNGITLYYTRTGGDKPPVLLLHGLAASGACWSVVARAIEQDYDVIMPDARGHGQSSAPVEGYGYEDQAGDVVDLIEALGLARPSLIGHSMGGLVAAMAAARYPELAGGLVLADPTFLSPEAQREVWESGAADQHLRYLKMSAEEVAAEARRRHPERSGEIIEIMAQARLQTSPAAFEVLRPPNPDHRELVRAFQVPSLLVIGGPAGVVSPATAAELQQLNARLRVAQIPEAGHGLHYDQPERFALVVKDFLGSVGEC